MAYISHSPFDYRSRRQRAGRLSPSLVMRSAIVAAAAAIAVLALSEGYSRTSAPDPVAAKADRLGAALVLPGETGRLTVDPVARISSVERGEVAALDPQSPMAAGVK